jgi:hypothetical protein
MALTIKMCKISIMNRIAKSEMIRTTFYVLFLKLALLLPS